MKIVYRIICILMLFIPVVVCAGESGVNQIEIDGMVIEYPEHFKLVDIQPNNRKKTENTRSDDYYFTVELRWAQGTSDPGDHANCVDVDLSVVKLNGTAGREYHVFPWQSQSWGEIIQDNYWGPEPYGLPGEIFGCKEIKDEDELQFYLCYHRRGANKQNIYYVDVELDFISVNNVLSFTGKIQYFFLEDKYATHGASGDGQYIGVRKVIGNDVPGSSQIPAVPKNVYATQVTQNSIDVSWTHDSDMNNTYEVWRKVNGGTPQKIGYTNKIPFTDPNLITGYSYQYIIRANNGTYYSPLSRWSNVVIVTPGSGTNPTPTPTPIPTPSSKPERPTELKVIPYKTNAVKLTWKDNSYNEDCFIIYDMSNWPLQPLKEIARVGAGVQEYIVNSLAYSNYYSFVIRAYNAAGVSEFSNAVGLDLLEPRITLISPDIDNKKETFENPLYPGDPVTIKWKVSGVNVNNFGIYLRCWYQPGRSNDILITKYSPIQTKSEYTYEWEVPTTRFYLLYELVIWDFNTNTKAIKELYIKEPRQFTVDSQGISMSYSGNDILTVSGILKAGSTTTFRANKRIEFVDGFDTADCKYFEAGGDPVPYPGTSSQMEYPYSPSVIPYPATGLTYEFTDATTVKLAWNASSNADGYEILRRRDGESYEILQRRYDKNNTTYIDTGLTPGESYYYRVRAANIYNVTKSSNQVKATLPMMPPIPQGLTAENVKELEIHLNWVDTINETKYIIYRRDTRSDYQLLTEVGANVTSFVDYDAQWQETYTYKIKAANEFYESEFSNTAEATTPLWRPSKPGNVTATAVSFDQVLLEWDASYHITNGYYIYRRKEGDGTYSYTKIATVNGVNTTSYTDTELEPNSTYHYYVGAFNDMWQTNSAVATVSTDMVFLACPQEFYVTETTETSVRLDWTGLIDDTTVYVITLTKVSTGEVTEYRTGSITLTITDLEPYTEYDVTIEMWMKATTTRSRSTRQYQGSGACHVTKFFSKASEPTFNTLGYDVILENNNWRWLANSDRGMDVPFKVNIHAINSLGGTHPLQYGHRKIKFLAPIDLDYTTTSLLADASGDNVRTNRGTNYFKVYFMDNNQTNQDDIDNWLIRFTRNTAATTTTTIDESYTLEYNNLYFWPNGNARFEDKFYLNVDDTGNLYFEVNGTKYYDFKVKAEHDTGIMRVGDNFQLCFTMERFEDNIIYPAGRADAQGHYNDADNFFAVYDKLVLDEARKFMGFDGYKQHDAAGNGIAGSEYTDAEYHSATDEVRDSWRKNLITREPFNSVTYVYGGKDNLNAFIADHEDTVNPFNYGSMNRGDVDYETQFDPPPETKATNWTDFDKYRNYVQDGTDDQIKANMKQLIEDQLLQTNEWYRYWRNGQTERWNTFIPGVDDDISLATNGTIEDRQGNWKLYNPARYAGVDCIGFVLVSAATAGNHALTPNKVKGKNIGTWRMPYNYDVVGASVSDTSDVFLNAWAIMHIPDYRYFISDGWSHGDIASSRIVPGDLLCEEDHVVIIDRVSYVAGQRKADVNETFVIEATPGSLMSDWKVLNSRSWKNLDDIPLAGRFYPRRLKE